MNLIYLFTSSFISCVNTHAADSVKSSVIVQNFVL